MGIKSVESLPKLYNERFMDGEEYAKIFGKYAWLLARVFHSSGRLKEALELCKLALLKLRYFGILYFILPLLKLAQDCTRDLEMPEGYKHYREYQTVIEELCQEYQEDWHFTDSMFHNYYQKEYHLDSEIIRGEHLERGDIDGIQRRHLILARSSF